MRVWLGLGGAVLAGVAAVVPSSPAFVERWFSTGVYPLVQRTLTPVSNLVPFALFDLLLVGAGAAMILVLARGVTRAVAQRRLLPVIEGLCLAGAMVAMGYLAFLGLWGLNYRRVPMEERIVLEGAVPTTTDVLALGHRIVTDLNALYDEAWAAGWSVEPWRDVSMTRAFAETQHLLADAPPAVPGRLKATALGPYFRWTGVDGMVNPFALEALGNPDLLPFEVPFVAAHEWAHLAGYADESEASFVAWLTCVRSGPPARYSGLLALYWQIVREVGPQERAELADALVPGARRDLEAIAERLRRGQLPTLRRAGWAVYDRYLKANRVEEGVRSYGIVISLLLRARFGEGWVPVRRAASRAAPVGPPG